VLRCSGASVAKCVLAFIGIVMSVSIYQFTKRCVAVSSVFSFHILSVCFTVCSQVTIELAADFVLTLWTESF